MINKLILALAFSLASICSFGQHDPTTTTVKPQSQADATRTLKSFRKLAEHPLFEMHYYGDYIADTPLGANRPAPKSQAPQWACSIFATYGENGSAFYGRNFDWYHNPAMILHTSPSDGYASISMVDISYLGFKLKDKKYDSIDGRTALLKAPLLPFDGMNEHGLTVGMAAVGDTELPNDAQKPNVGSLQIIRLMLDQAKTTDQALAIFDRYNVKSVGGPNIHYLIADASGSSALVELKDGKQHIIRSDKNWHSATNFYLTGTAKPLTQCRRFAQIDRTMNDHRGTLDLNQTFALLKNISQQSTQWSIVYDMQAKSAQISLARNFNKRRTIKLNKRFAKQTDSPAK